MKKWMTLAGCVLAAATAYGAQDQLSTAKDLYASAAYEDALSLLTRLAESGSGAPAISRQADEYRAFCLYALGRTAEAESVAESLIRKDPLIQVNREDASPRIEAMFTAVRKRLLPGLIRDEYRAARAAFDAKRVGEAEPHLMQANRMLAEAQEIGAWDDTLADLRVLIDGFLELNRAASQRPPERPAPGPGDAAAASQPATASPASEPPATAVTPRATRVYNVNDTDVAPPVPVRQVIPGAPPSLIALMSTKAGVLDVEIDERGAVQQVVLRVPLHPAYDRLIVQAAHNWEYRPAMKAGVPVRYLKTVAINVRQ